MKVTFFDSYRFAGEHEMVNSCFLEMLANIFRDSEIHFFAHHTHLAAVRKLFRSSRIIEHELIMVNRPRILFYIIALFNDLFRLIVHRNNELLIFASVNPLSLLFLRLYRLFFSGNIVLVCHGELECLLNRKSTTVGFGRRLLENFYRFAFSLNIRDGNLYVILGEPIKQNLLTLGYKRKFITIHHPYRYEDKCLQKNLLETVQLGSAGVGTSGKGTPLIFRLASRPIPNNKGHKFEFVLIGKQWYKLPSAENVRIIGNEGFMSRDDYDEEVRRLDYLLYFYPIASYKLIASGAFFDAIRFEKPIIALRNDFFEYYFNRYGNIGYLCDSFDELAEQLELIDDVTYQEQIKCIRCMKEELNLDKIESVLREQFVKLVSLT